MAVRRHIAQAAGQLRRQLVGDDADLKLGMTEHRHLLRQHRTVEAKRTAIIGGLVERQPADTSKIAGIPGACAMRQIKRHITNRTALIRLLRKTIHGQVEPVAPAFGDALKLDPLSVACFKPVLRHIEFPFPDTQRRPTVNSGILALQPAVPPFQCDQLKAESRSGLAMIGIMMPPWPDNATAQIRASRDKWHHRIGIAITPAADGQDRT